MSSPAALSVLFVCTGNVCRSPVAERLLAARLPGVTVTSRGIAALDGAGIDPPMAAQLAARGGNAEGFRAATLERVDLDVDLVLTMSRRQRLVVIEEFPQVARRIGLLGEVGRLAQAVSTEPGLPLERHIAAWSRQRPSGAAEMPDPYRRGEQAAAHAAELIDTHIEQLVALLGTRA